MTGHVARHRWSPGRATTWARAFRGGRLRQAFRRLRGLGLRGWLHRERGPLRLAAKTALASTVSWEIAVGVLGSPVPVLAPLAAVLTVQGTVLQTIKRGVQYAASVIAGVFATLFLANLLGARGWSIGLVIFVTLVAGRALRLGPQSNQVAISALLVLSLGRGYGIARVLDTVVGAGVGILANLVVPPPTRVERAARTVADLGDDLAGLLADVGHGLTAGWGPPQAQHWLERARGLRHAVASAEQAADEGEESLRLHPRGREAADAVERIREGLVALDHVAGQVRGLARTLADDADAVAGRRIEVPAAFAGSLLAAAGALAAFAQVQERAPRDCGRHVDRLRTCLRTAAARGREAAVGMRAGAQATEQAWEVRGALLADLQRLLREVDPDHGPHARAVPGGGPPRG